ncbi:Hypoxia induced protein domain [Trinorchestia longiramus]|nr:Hypoxia induced protein domain [Trinorchestia longiramus]
MGSNETPDATKIMVMDDENESKMSRKFRESPHMVIGMVGWCGIVAYGLYGIRKRKQSLAMHLIHTRVIAQACVVGMLTLGVGYKLYNDHIAPRLFPSSPKEQPPH